MGKIEPSEGPVAVLWRPGTDDGGSDAAATLHIGDLDGSSTGKRGTWTATVDVLVLDDAGLPVSHVTVSGSWSGGASGSDSCTTESDGWCRIRVSGIHNRNKSVTFTVLEAAHSDLTYDPTANADPDGDSDGTSITVTKP